MTLQSGARLGPYEVLAAIGAGGMGEVYRARDTRLGREVAIKVLPGPLSASADLRKRFEREARAVSSLNHPHICTLYDIGCQDGVEYLVMELIEGESLAAHLARGALPRDQALQRAIEIADALSAAHRLGIVHRDLKPANVMLAKTGAKLLDFGVATFRPADALTNDTTLSDTLTASGGVVGTLRYMAPEQIEGKPADPRTDIFAFGALLYEMLSGNRAFEAQTNANVIAAILKEEPRALDAGTIPAPWGLDRLIRKCLAKDPDTRWQSAQDLRDELRWISTGGGNAPGRVVAQHSAHAAWTVATVALIGMTLALAWAWVTASRIPSAETPEVRLDLLTPPPRDTNSLLSIALSPDGRDVVFVAATDGVNRLWLRSLRSPTPTLLKGTDGASFPFWKPDGRAIGFFARGMLNRIDIAGGAVQPLAPAIAGRGGAWSQTGTIVFTPDNISPLYRIPDTGGMPVAVTRLIDGRQNSHRFPQFLPDGQHVVFYAGSGDTAGVYAASLATGEPSRVVQADTSATLGAGSRLFFIQRGTLYAGRFDQSRLAVEGDLEVVAEEVAFNPGKGAFSSSMTGAVAYRAGGRVKEQLVWFDRAGKPLRSILPPDGGGPFNADLATDGRVLFQRSFEGSGDIWLSDGSGGGLVRATVDTAAEWCAVWAPDSRRFAFASNRAGAFDIYQKPIGGAEEALVLSSDVKIPTDWSRDGRFLLYRVHKATRSDLWIVPLAGSQRPFPFVESRFDEREGQFSPDTRWVAFQSDESGRYQIYLQAFPGPGEKIPVTVDGGTQPRWRADGRELFYIAPDEQLMSVPVAVTANGQPPQVRAPVALFQTRISFGAVPGANRQQYAVAPDGQQFLISVGAVSDTDVAPPITIVLQWNSRSGIVPAHR